MDIDQQLGFPLLSLRASSFRYCPMITCFILHRRQGNGYKFVVDLEKCLKTSSSCIVTLLVDCCVPFAVKSVGRYLSHTSLSYSWPQNGLFEADSASNRGFFPSLIHRFNTFWFPGNSSWLRRLQRIVHLWARHSCSQKAYVQDLGCQEDFTSPCVQNPVLRTRAIYLVQ